VEHFLLAAQISAGILVVASILSVGHAQVVDTMHSVPKVAAVDQGQSVAHRYLVAYA
jgi:hypothetical protein